MRITVRLDIKNNFVIKGILRGFKKDRDPISIANNYYEQKIDEIIYIDSVASLYGEILYQIQSKRLLKMFLFL